jgi:hypothetical protein
MKRLVLPLLTLLIILLNLPIKTYAEPVSIKAAEKIANGKIQSLGKTPEFSIQAVDVEIVNQDQQILCFIFRLSPAGYIVVAGDNGLPPVIAYSFLDKFSNENIVDNPLVSMLKADITMRLASMDQLSISVIQARKNEWKRLEQFSDSFKSNALFQQWPPEGTTSTGGWLETNYTQSPPYNNFCPMDPVTNQRSLAGCPATAMAQVLNYYRTANNTVFTDNDDYYHAYAGRNFWIDDDYITIDFPSFPDLNAYLDTITMSFENNSVLKNSEKAALTFACGVAAQQVYTSQGSGTFGVNQAEESYLRFGFAEASLLEGTNPFLFNQLSQNMMDARPAHLAIVDPGWTMGHNVVVDGYNTDNYYHLNFGWGGGYNGWYLLPDEIPYGLTVIEGLIVNIAWPQVNTGLTYHPTTKSGSLLQVYPNPVIDKLNIGFSINKLSQVNIEICDINGSIILSLSEKSLQAGSYNKIFNLKESKAVFASGLYLCNLKIADKVLTQKFIIR